MMSEEFPYALFVEGEWDPKTPTLKNKFTIYFQSKKSNGGDCSVEISEGQRVVVRFKKAEVRQNVLEKGTHEVKLGKDVVKLTVSLPPAEIKIHEPGFPVQAGDQADLLHSEDIKAVKRRSEACSEWSPVPDLKRPRICVTKSNEESPAKNRSPLSGDTQGKEEQDEHDADDDCGDLSVRSVVLKNIQNMNQEFLSMLVENVVKDDPEYKDFIIEVIPESNCAVITFTNRKCAVNFIKSCPCNSTFKKKNLEVRPLERTAKVKAEGLAPNMITDYITLYFEKYGDIKDDVEMLEDGKSALINFKDPAVVNTVLTAQHQLNKLPIKVFPYYDSLATALYGKDRPTVCLPEAFIENIDRSVWKYIQEHRESMDQIKQDMSQHFCQVDLKDSAVRISPLPSLLHQGAQTRKLIQSWREKVSAQFTTALSKYKSQVVTVQRDAWDESEAEIYKALQSEPVTLFCNKEKGAVTIAGLSEDVIRTANVVQNTIKQITQRIQREKDSVNDEITMDSAVYEIVMKCGLEQEIKSNFPELELNYHIHNQKITFYGLKQEVLETKNKILQCVIGLRKKVVEVHPSIVEFLAKENLQELCRELFLNKGISASLEVFDNRATVVAKTENALRDSEKQLKTLLHHECIDVEDSSVLMNAEWHDLVTHLNDTFNSPVKSVLINTSSNKVVVSGFADEVHVAQKQMSDYMLKSSEIIKTLEADKIAVKFIHEYRKHDWFEKVKNKVTVDFKDGTVSLGGPRVHVSQGLQIFKDLFSSVYQCNFKLAKPGAKKFFKLKESDYASLAMKETGCLIELIDERDDLDVSTGKKGVTTPDGVEIIVSKGDMCFYSGDAVVNAANENLDLCMGLSKALSDAAGPELQTACKKIIQARKMIPSGDAVLTKVGQLRCKYIIHAVGPRFDHSDAQKSAGLLKKAVTRSLNLADREKCQSIAIPAISSGSLGFPLDLCADTIVAALKDFFAFVGGDSCLKKIHLIDNNDKTVQALEAAVQKVYGDKSTKHGATFRDISSNQPQNLNTAPQLPPQSSSSQGLHQNVKTNEGLTITFSNCNIQDTSVDVVVNSLSSDLDLKHGAISNAILKAAGPQLQLLLNQQATAPANTGDIFITAGCNLNNKLVFHAVAPHYKGLGSEQKALKDIMEKCLNYAEQQQQGSIVFPAIGTGKLGFPKSLVASVMLDSVLQFSKKRSSTHVQEVMIALHPTDTQTIQAFTDEFNKMFNVLPSSSSSATQQQSKGLFSKVTSLNSGIYETTVGGVVLQVLTGDITTETTDVIVNSTNGNFTLKAGVSKAILDAAGPNVEAECLQLAQKNEGLIMTQQGNLKCKKILHIYAQNDPAMIHKLVKLALKMCVEQNFSSISFPAFGTGQGGVNAGQAADAMLEGIADFVMQNPQSSLKVVHIVIFQAPMLADFHQSMLKKESNDQQKKEGVISRMFSFAKSLFTPWFNFKQEERKDFVIEGQVVDPACFSICGPSQAAVDQAKTWIDKTISDEQESEPIIDPMILKLSDEDQQRIQELQRLWDVTVKIEYKAQGVAAGDSGEAKLTVEGLSRDVLKAASEIQTILRRTREGIGLKKDIQLASELVDWRYELGGQYHSFDPEINFRLEKALNNSSPHVDITFQGKVYKVSLPDGPAVGGRNQMKIKRIDKTDNLPQDWEHMSPSALYQLFPLQTGSREYNEVLKEFRKSCNNIVIKIERIQNPGMWKKYQSNKQIMEQKNGHMYNERKLFHGTREEIMDHINRHGFNRSFAGHNATAFGKGTYFAVHAIYSAQDTYSVPGQQGQKHMYLCRVLTGDYTVGNKDMVVPPAKNNSSTDLYDTVVDKANSPSMFVVFRDDHAYPDYLITFT